MHIFYKHLLNNWLNSSANRLSKFWTLLYQRINNFKRKATCPIDFVRLPALRPSFPYYGQLAPFVPGSTCLDAFTGSNLDGIQKKLLNCELFMNGLSLNF